MKSGVFWHYRHSNNFMQEAVDDDMNLSIAFDKLDARYWRPTKPWTISIARLERFTSCDFWVSCA